MATTNTPITSVWSAYGHRFMSTDSEEHESCLTCGAMYELSPFESDPSRGEYHAANGDQPMACTSDTSMVHGYTGERHCAECDDIDGCGHCRHNCNCLFCA